MKKRGAQQLSLVGMPKATKSMPTGPPTEAEKLRDIAATAPMRIMADERGVAGITSSGQFKTQHETGTSNPQATFDPSMRARAEDRMHGPGQRPVYGYFSHGDTRDLLTHDLGSGEPRRWDQVSGYGNTAFELKEHMRPHTTYAWGDSLGGQPEDIVKQGGISPLLAEEEKNPARALASPYTRADTFYTEMHVHRPTTTADVSKALVYETPDHAYEPPLMPRAAERTERVTGHLRAAGIPHEVRSVGLGGQQVLPLEHEDWGDAHWSKVGPGHSGKKIDDKAGWQPGRYGYYTPADEQRAMSTTKRTWKPGAS